MNVLARRHGQLETRRFSCWCGFSLDHLMIGIDLDRTTRCIVASVGPFYIGAGLYDKEFYV